MENTPYAWIHWTRTATCVTCYCSCGDSFHIDANEPLYVQCMKCKQIYALHNVIQLDPLESVPPGHYPPLVDDSQMRRIEARKEE